MKYDHVAFQVSNLDAAIEFYTKKLEFRLISIDTSEESKIKFAFLDFNGSKLELLENLAGPYSKPQVVEPYCPHYCIEVDDINAAVDHLKANDIEILSGPFACVAGETLVYFADLDGNVFEYVQWLSK